jgi:hypothetical protein
MTAIHVAYWLFQVSTSLAKANLRRLSSSWQVRSGQPEVYDSDSAEAGVKPEGLMRATS